MELAKSRAFVPRAVSNQSSPTGAVGVREQATEQLVLYLKSLHLLSSSLQLAKSEMAADRLQPSHTVKNSTYTRWFRLFFTVSVNSAQLDWGLSSFDDGFVVLCSFDRDESPLPHLPGHMSPPPAAAPCSPLDHHGNGHADSWQAYVHVSHSNGN